MGAGEKRELVSYEIFWIKLMRERMGRLGEDKGKEGEAVGSRADWGGG